MVKISGEIAIFLTAMLMVAVIIVLYNWWLYVAVGTLSIMAYREVTKRRTKEDDNVTHIR